VSTSPEGSSSSASEFRKPSSRRARRCGKFASRQCGAAMRRDHRTPHPNQERD
jgi:hypothetical protein